MDTDDDMKHNWHRMDRRRGHETREFLLDVWGLVKAWKLRRRKKANDKRERKQAAYRRALHKPEMTEQEFYDREYSDEG